VKRIFFSVIAKAGKVLLLTPPLAYTFRKLLYKAAREHDYEKTQGIMKDVFKKIISEDLKPLLAKINAPTLIMWGKDDRITPVKDAYFVNNKIAGSRLKIFDNQSHRLPYEKSKLLAKEIDLWQTSLHT
jgi:pimeloyl-ACP methyl ester carboxylesterase